MIYVPKTTAEARTFKLTHHPSDGIVDNVRESLSILILVQAHNDGITPPQTVYPRALRGILRA